MTLRNRPLAAAIAAFAFSTALLLALCLRATGGRFLLLLDDAYIHLSLARTLATSGVWGISAAEPASASSSILWPILLATAGRQPALLPGFAFLLAAAASVLLIVRFDRVLRRAAPELRDFPRTLALLLLVFGTALPTLSLTGMEHTLHAFSILLLFERILAAEDGAGSPLPLALAAAFSTSLRYESLFPVAIGALVLLRSGRRKCALALFVGGAAPAALFAVYGMTHGLPPIPASILAKAYHPRLDSGFELLRLFGGRALRNLLRAPHLLALALAAAVSLWRVRLGEENRPTRSGLLLFLGTLGLQVQVASVGWLHRYEAFLIPVGLLALAPHRARGGDPKPGRIRRLALAAVVATLLLRAVLAVRDAPAAARDRLRKHVLPLEAIAAEIGDTVVVNDIGIASFFSRARILDLAGLAGRDPILATREPGPAPREALAAAARARGARVAILETNWRLVHERLPPDWILVAEWTLPKDRVFGDERVAFFALVPEEAPRLRRALTDFAQALPPDVRSDLAPPAPR